MADIVISQKEIESIINDVDMSMPKASALDNSSLCGAIDIVIVFLGTLNPTNPLLKIGIQLVIALLNAYKAKNCSGS
ncbi:MAG: hypothetical protein QM758_02635 [Armatimonas sp.]